jgi:hypothetical protein
MSKVVANDLSLKRKVGSKEELTVRNGYDDEGR